MSKRKKKAKKSTAKAIAAAAGCGTITAATWDAGNDVRYNISWTYDAPQMTATYVNESTAINKARHLVVCGKGEVGNALISLLSKTYDVEWNDLEPKDLKPGFDVAHICLNYAYLGATNQDRTDKFLSIVRGYMADYAPKWVDVCSSVPPGVVEQLGPTAVHSTTRGLHPRLDESIETFRKFVSGPKEAADAVAASYEKAGVKCTVWPKAKMGELAHPASNALLGACLAVTDEIYELCRWHGVDFSEVVLEYNRTSNEGYAKLGHFSKMRPLLYPPGGRIGGHCLVSGARILLDSVPEEVRKKLPILARVAGYAGEDRAS